MIVTHILRKFAAESIYFIAFSVIERNIIYFQLIQKRYEQKVFLFAYALLCLSGRNYQRDIFSFLLEKSSFLLEIFSYPLRYFLFQSFEYIFQSLEYVLQSL